MKNLLADFILRGNIKKLVIGQPIDTSEGDWISSIDLHSNGVPKLYKWTLDELVINVVVTSDNKIEYFVVHIKDQDKNVDIHIGGYSIKIGSVTIEEFLTFLNINKIEWRFKRVFEKIVFILLEESNVELIFSYYPHEDMGLQIIQTSYDGVIN